MTKKERERLLEQLYHEDRIDEYVALLTENFTDYDWARIEEAMNTPIYNEFTGQMEPSYNEQYR